jgi:hypothetical protein
VIAAIDQHVADAVCAQLAEGDLLWVGGHGWRVGTGPFRPLAQLGKFVTFTTLPVAS